MQNSKHELYISFCHTNCIKFFFPVQQKFDLVTLNINPLNAFKKTPLLFELPSRRWTSFLRAPKKANKKNKTKSSFCLLTYEFLRNKYIFTPKKVTMQFFSFSLTHVPKTVTQRTKSIKKG